MERGQQEHDSKVFLFDANGQLVVEVGAPSNASNEPDRGPPANGVDPAPLFVQHGGFWRFKDQPNQDQLRDGYRLITGIRHILAMAVEPVSRQIYFVQNGRDQLNTIDPADYTAAQNAELPAEEVHVLADQGNYGWPYTYWDPFQKARMLSPEFGGDGKKKADPAKYPPPLLTFPAHWAPMAMIFYTGTQFPEKYRNGAFVAFHGSWNRAPLPQQGYRICFMPFDAQGKPVGTYETFADNFAGIPVIISPGQAAHRPCGLCLGPDGSIYVTDTEHGRVWRIFYTGQP